MDPQPCQARTATLFIQFLKQKSSRWKFLQLCSVLTFVQELSRGRISTHLSNCGRNKMSFVRTSYICTLYPETLLLLFTRWKISVSRTTSKIGEMFSNVKWALPIHEANMDDCRNIYGLRCVKRGKGRHEGLGCQEVAAPLPACLLAQSLHLFCLQGALVRLGGFTPGPGSQLAGPLGEHVCNAGAG